MDLRRVSRTGAPVSRSWGSGPGASASHPRRIAVTWRTSAPLAAILSALLLGACAAGAGLPSQAPASPSSSPSPAASQPASVVPGAPQPPIDTQEEAIAAVGAFDSQFLGYQPLDPDIIGASAWVEVQEETDGYSLVFVRGSGDCPAGCINRAYAKFLVSREGAVELRCEWSEGGEAQGTPC